MFVGYISLVVSLGNHLDGLGSLSHAGAYIDSTTDGIHHSHSVLLRRVEKPAGDHSNKQKQVIYKFALAERECNMFDWGVALFYWS